MLFLNKALSNSNLGDTVYLTYKALTGVQNILFSKPTALLLTVFLLSSCGGGSPVEEDLPPNNTPSPTATIAPNNASPPTPTPTESPTPTPTESPTPTPTETTTPTPTESPTPTPTETPTPSPTETPTPTPSPTALPTVAPLIPDTGPDPSLPLPGDSTYDSARDAARFLHQATFGPTAKTITAFLSTTREAWLEQQFNLPQTKHLPLLDEWVEDLGLEAVPTVEIDEEGWVRELARSDIWWASAVWGEDQLRQRIAYALSQILVISNVSDVLFNDSRGIANYHDILAEHAFGNYRDLLEAITLNPMMGEYLSMIRNEKADEARNIRPDENYARELMQLFSIGLVELNIDGTIKLDNEDKPTPTYGQDDIKALARVFTGWNMSTANNWWHWVSWGEAEITPMKAFEEYHDSDAKILFGANTIEANQSPISDVQTALDIIFNHPNIGPFLSKQLIQRLITSNPSPEYVARVANVFNDNGTGIKGDLKAVVSAILLDDEARNGHLSMPNTFGKIREPIIKVANFWRAFKAQGSTIDHGDGNLSLNRLRLRGSDRELGQRPYGSFSVFNFYRPDYQHPGEIKQAGLNSPEMQILTESQIISGTNFMANSTFWADSQEQWRSDFLVPQNWDTFNSDMYFEDEKAMAGDLEGLLNKINLLLFSGHMSPEMYNLLLNHSNSVPQYKGFYWKFLVYELLFVSLASPEYALQR